ncbi:MAG: hypothetical protein LIR10_09700 [Bacillota bacterium]|nr:hypothetical protein [Bacillota bacterium]
MLKKYRNYFIWFDVIILGIGILGRFLPYGSSEFNFIFENMIWFPIEVTLTVLILDKIIQLRENEKEKNRYQRIVGRHSAALISKLKRQIVYYFRGPDVNDNAESIKNKFKEISDNPDNLLTQVFFDSMREFNFLGNPQKTIYNYQGMAFQYMSVCNKSVEQYINRYSVFLDDDVFQILDNLQNKFRDVGKLDFASESLWIRPVNHSISDGLTQPIIEMIQLVNELDNKFKEVVK